MRKGWTKECIFRQKYYWYLVVEKFMENFHVTFCWVYLPVFASCIGMWLWNEWNCKVVVLNDLWRDDLGYIHSTFQKSLKRRAPIFKRNKRRPCFALNQTRPHFDKILLLLCTRFAHFHNFFGLILSQITITVKTRLQVEYLGMEWWKYEFSINKHHPANPTPFEWPSWCKENVI